MKTLAYSLKVYTQSMRKVEFELKVKVHIPSIDAKSHPHLLLNKGAMY